MNRKQVECKKKPKVGFPPYEMKEICEASHTLGVRIIRNTQETLRFVLRELYP